MSQTQQGAESGGLPFLGRPSCLWLLSMIPLTLAVGVAIWLKRRRQRGPTTLVIPLPPVTFYARLLEVLERHCQLRPRLSQTPQEFATAAEQTLRSRLHGPAVAEIPRIVIGSFYRIRFGHRPLTLPENQEIDRQVSEMDAVLAAGTPAQT